MAKSFSGQSTVVPRRMVFSRLMPASVATFLSDRWKGLDMVGPSWGQAV
jgi:hypothetical protein